MAKHFATARVTPNLARLGLFAFGIQVVWGALLGVSLQARASELAPGWTLNAYALLAGCGAAVAAVTQIAAGFVSDAQARSGKARTHFYLLGACVGAAGVWGFYTSVNFAQALASVLLLQTGMNVAIGAYQAVIPDYVVHERMGSASSWMAGLQSLGNAAGALVAGLVADVRFIAGFITLAILGTGAVTAAYTTTLAREPFPPERAKLTRAYADLFISRALVYLGFYTMLGYLFFLIQDVLGNAHAKAFTGYTLLAVTLAGAAGAALAAKPADRVDQRAVACAGGAAFVASIAALIVMRGGLPIVACGAAAGIAWGVFLTADWALGCRFIPRAHAAVAMSIWNLALVLPQVAAPLAASAAIALAGKAGGTHVRIAFMLAMAEVAAGVLWLWRLPARDARSG